MASNELHVGQAAVAGVEKKLVLPKGVSDLSDMGGRFQVEHFRKGVRISSYSFKNGIVNEGKNFLLDVMFHGTAAKSPWYLGLIDKLNYTSLADDDKYDDIDQAGNGWDEFSLYTDPGNGGSAATRPEWTEGSASAQSITNSSVVQFDITGSGDVKGVFLAGGTNAQTKSDHTAVGNILWATALFPTDDVTVVNADELKVTYTVSC